MSRTTRLFGWSAMFFAAILSLSATGRARGQGTELRYQGNPGQQFAYEFDISVDLPDKTTFYKGTTWYTVNSSNANQLNLTYRGGLMETSKGKSTGIPRGPFGPRFGGPFGPGFGPPGSPFARSQFAGKTQTTNRITMTTRGGVLTMEGESQLPYLLGNVSLLPFEILPEGNVRQWKHDSGISIEQASDNTRRPFGPFGPIGGPFGQQDDKKIQAGQEDTDYVIQSEDDQKIVIKKTYRLKTPPVGDEPGFDMNGEGTWTYNRKDHLPEATDFKHKLVIAEGNTQTTVPITVSFRRLTADAITKIEQDTKKRHTELAEKAAADKQKAESALTPAEKQNSLAALASGNSTRIEETLKSLRAKTPKDPDAEIAAAIESLLRHANPKTRDDAKATLMNWSPDFKRRQKLNEAYAGHMPVDSTGREVDSGTPLYLGQILQYQDHGSFWHAGEVLELMPDGKVKLRKRGFAPRELVVSRRNLQLAPDEVEQPNRPSSFVASAGPALRTWTDASGTFKIEASYLGIVDGKVKLRRADGKEIAVPLDKLSQADRQHVENLKSTVKNPFE